MSEIIQLEDKYYISINSSYADNRVKILNHANTFGIFDRRGDIKKIGEEIQGLYHNGTRFISDLELRINNVRPMLLSSAITEQNEILSIDLTNPVLSDKSYYIPNDTLYIGRSKFLRDGICHEQIWLCNYGSEKYKFDLTLSFDADFKDIFEVRGVSRKKRGEVFEIAHMPDNKLRISYLGLDKIRRFTEIIFSITPTGWAQHNKAIFEIELSPHQYLKFDYTLLFLTGNEVKENTGYARGRQIIEEELRQESVLSTQIVTSNEKFNSWIERSRSDLLSLLAKTKFGKYPYAGVPWYNTAFGRDGIITALQTLWIAPEIARDVLFFLAHTQAKEIDAYRDAEPGKIIHEVREGEMVELCEVPFKRYYGSIDATPLFIILAGVYYTRTADIDTIKIIWKHIEAAINWIDRYGDINGDGFVDYQHKSETGLANQGWKDSYDSISDDSGQLAMPPIALSEVQAYVYSARIQAAMLADKLGYQQRAIFLQHQAEELKRKFNEHFWDEELQCFVLALDGNGKKCRVVSSNAGQCLFFGIADNDKATKTVSRLMKDDMYSGWGIRTLSKNEVRFNPMSYHNGSVWPHDVALIARGFSRYGFLNDAQQLMTALFDASQFIELQRLPELFCGFERRKGEGPTHYPVACSPQSWSVGALFMLLEALLNIEILAEEKKVYFKKIKLPAGIDTIAIRQLRLGQGLADIEFFRQFGSVRLKVNNCPEDWKIFFEPV